MATTCPFVISVSPTMYQPHYNLYHLQFLDPIFPNAKHKSPLKTSFHKNQLNPEIGDERIEHERQLFDDLPNRNEVTLSAVIATRSQCGDFTEAFYLFKKMLCEGLRPNGFALASLLKASPRVGEIGLGRELHGWCIRAGLGLDIGVRTALISMYSHCGMLGDARQIFDETPVSCSNDVSLWNSIIMAYILVECWMEAFGVFGELLSFGLVAPTELTYACIVKACGSAGEKKYGKMVHGRIMKDGLLEATSLWNSLVTFYANCGNLEDAKSVFERISRKDVVSWNAIIAACEQNGEEENAINLFHRMVRIRSLVQPNRITLLSVLSAISGLVALKRGREIHAYIIREGLEVVTSVANSLITMYSKCGEVLTAGIVFESLVDKDVITWNSMLSGHEQNEQQEQCFDLFRKMQLSGIRPDSHTFTVILSAASSETSRLLCLRRGREIHGYIMRKTAQEGMTLPISNALLTMYTKFNRLADAESIFKGMKNRDSYSLNAMMDGYSSNARFNDAHMIFLDMLKQGSPIDNLSLSILITSCGRLVSLQLGKQIHAVVAKLFYDRGFAFQNSLLSLNNALVSMYSKCGSINDAAQVFLRMRRRDVFSWTALITGYAYHGMAFEAIQLYEGMKTDGINPNHVTFLGILIACAHGGLVQRGTHFFKHYACMIDLFSRSGQFDCAKSLVESGVKLFGPHHSDTLNLWRVLLGACHVHKQLQIGVDAAAKILELEPEDEATHILLANLYASSGLWEDAIKVREAMTNKGLKKEVGCSWIDVRNVRHIFVAGDVFHPQRKEIYEKLGELDVRLKRMGYVPLTEIVLHDVDEVQKKAIIGCHSEKLAVTFGLLQCGVGNQGVIRVIKNLRVCEDCHNWMKFTSRLEGRDIILRDSRRFHFFSKGRCSCADFW